MATKKQVMTTLIILVMLVGVFYLTTKVITKYTGMVTGDGTSTDICLEKGIQGYPTWEINGNLYPGEQSLDKLAKLSGCAQGLDSDSLAKCLSDKGVKMYGAFWCGHCQNQKAEFNGNLEKYNIYVECDPRA